MGRGDLREGTGAQVSSMGEGEISGVSGPTCRQGSAAAASKAPALVGEDSVGAPAAPLLMHPYPIASPGSEYSIVV